MERRDVAPYTLHLLCVEEVVSAVGLLKGQPLSEAALPQVVLHGLLGALEGTCRQLRLRVGQGGQVAAVEVVAGRPEQAQQRPLGDTG